MKRNRKAFSALLCFLMILFVFGTAYETTVCKAEEFSQAQLERQAIPIESNMRTDWPEGPVISAKSAILMEANTGVILYAKDIDRQMYPASTTKLMTGLLAFENCELDEMVFISESALASVPSDGSRMGIKAAERLTVEQAIYALMVQSANEVANALGEHISVTEKAFAEKMNERAVELGCKNTHFENASGLNNDDHLTTAYDLALIGREYFSHELLANAASTPSYRVEEVENVHGAYTMQTKNKLYRGKAYEYPYLVGSKTGFLGVAGQTLVSCAEKDGMRLICVVLFEDDPYQYTDTVKLFDYGFSSFSYLAVDKNLMTGFSSSEAFLLDESDKLIVPNGVTFGDLAKTMNKSEAASGQVTIDYTYKGTSVGSVKIIRNPEFTAAAEDASEKTVYVNILYTVLFLFGFALALNLLTYLTNSVKQFHFGGAKTKKRKRRKFSATDYDKYRF